MERMDERNLYQSIQKRHGTNELTLKETCKEIGISYSKASKYFGGNSAFSDTYIKKHKLLPIWVQNEGEHRKWPIIEIVKWLRRTEKNG